MVFLCYTVVMKSHISYLTYGFPDLITASLIIELHFHKMKVFLPRFVVVLEALIYLKYTFVCGMR